MSPFLSGVLSLVEADAEVALIPPVQTFLTAIIAAKTSLGRAAAVAQLEGNVLAAGAALGPELIAQLAPQLNAALQAQLAKAQATVTAGLQPVVALSPGAIKGVSA